ncbi:MAG: hypothetical protein KAR79_02505 [Simkaniaceae bacterium]|nr:hypothetical protein [Simkaniaceae bacterium]
MNFTREPIIETIISPKDGYKIIVRNSSLESHEEYSVDAIEVVSFGKSFFFRSLERPKSFLVPVEKYEIVETKETRMVIKKAVVEKSIKIAGGKTPNISTKQTVAEKAEDGQKKDRRKSKKKPTEKAPPKDKKIQETNKALEGGSKKDEVKVSSSGYRSLLPPPKSLISENMERYKNIENTAGIIPSKKVEPIVESPTEELLQEEIAPAFSFDEAVEAKEELIVPMPSLEEELPFTPPFAETEEVDQGLLNKEEEPSSLEEKKNEGYSIE